MLPPAPVLFSTGTGCPRASCSFGAMRRAERSTGPLAAYGTMKWMGLDGQAWPSTWPAIAVSTAPTHNRIAALGVFGGERLVALLADRRQRDDHQQDRGGDQEAQADRLGRADEDKRIPSRKQHRPSQVLLHQRPEDEAEDHRRRLALELHADVAEDPERRHDQHIEGVVGEA